MQSSHVILLTLYALSTLASFELFLIFTRVKKNITLRFFLTFYILFGLVIFIGQGITRGNIKSLNTELCRAQALVMLFLLSMLFALNFFVTFNVWSAICRSKFRDLERERVKWFLFGSFVGALIPTLVVAILNSREEPGKGFGPHAVYCTYMYPLHGYAYGPLWYNALWCITTISMIIHAGIQLVIYRSRLLTSLDQSSSAKYNSGSGNTSSGGRISLGMCYRFGIWAMVFLAVMVCANFSQVRAVIEGEYTMSDAKVGIREYSGAIAGIAVFLVFGSGRAAWTASTPYILFQKLSHTKKSPIPNTTSPDGYDMAGYYDMNTVSTRSGPTSSPPVNNQYTARPVVYPVNAPGPYPEDRVYDGPTIYGKNAGANQNPYGAGHGGRGW